MLVGVTAVIALEAEPVSGALEAASGTLGLSPLFLGVIVLAPIGTAADLFAAARFARRDRMGLVPQICVGSAIQVALVVAPLPVLISRLVGHPMIMVSGNPLDPFAIAGAAFAIDAIASDGETIWFEGLLPVGVSVLLGFASFSVGPAREESVRGGVGVRPRSATPGRGTRGADAAARAAGTTPTPGESGRGRSPDPRPGADASGVP